MSGQTVYLIFAEQASPFDAEERIDPLVGIVSDEVECFRLRREHPDDAISWEEHEVDDAGEHVITSGAWSTPITTWPQFEQHQTGRGHRAPDGCRCRERLLRGRERAEDA